MYRNCPEHTEIVDFIQNGERNKNLTAGKRIMFEEMGGGELQFGETEEISAEEYGRLCLKRRQ